MRPSVIAAALASIATSGGLVYMQTTRESATHPSVSTNERASTTSAGKSAPMVQQQITAANTDTTNRTVPTATETMPTSESASAPAPAAFAQLVKDTESPIAKERAAAIAALADAPTAQALPALKKVIEVGEPNVDRHIALRSLHSLALRDGDTNGLIRDVMRQAVYHGDDDGVTQTAQSLLDDIEAEFSEREQNEQ